MTPWTPSFTIGERLKYALIPPRLNLSRLIRRELRRGEAELRLLPDLVPQGKIAIDVGANKGIYTELLARLCPRVEAFEPNPKMFWILRRATRANVVAHQVALSDRSGEAVLHIPGKGGKYSNQRATLQPRTGADDGHVMVETRSLDSYDFHNVGFIKIDVEGFESAVLKGAEATLARERPVLLIEMEERHTHDPIESSIASVAARGYDIFFVRNGMLRPIAEFEPDRDHRLAVNSPGYVFNFIAKPRS